MTADELYEYGRKSEPAMVCIPRELVQSLPKLERINGRIVLQYWYYFRNVSFPVHPNEPLYYAAFDPYAGKLVEMKALTDAHKFMASWLDMVSYSDEMREVKYLEHCTVLLERGDITEEEIIQTQAMWLDAQAKDVFPELYNISGVRPEAVQMLLNPEMADNSRHILRIWDVESSKYRKKKAEGYEKITVIGEDLILGAERDVFFDLLRRGPSSGTRSQREF